MHRKIFDLKFFVNDSSLFAIKLIVSIDRRRYTVISKMLVLQELVEKFLCIVEVKLKDVKKKSIVRQE